MVDFTKNKSWAETQVIEDDADTGKIGKSDSQPAITTDADTVRENGYFVLSSSASNKPAGSSTEYHALSMRGTSNVRGFHLAIGRQNDEVFFRREDASVYSAWQEILHEGNTINVKFSTAAITPGTADRLTLGRTAELLQSDTVITGTQFHQGFHNPNGQVGSISTNGVSTGFNISSDPRLKDFRVAPTDIEINAEFDKLFSCSRVFNWKAEPAGDIVWGFDAHACIDANLDLGVEGRGPRELALGEIYNIIPAVIEQHDQQVLYKTGDKKGELRFNTDGSPMMETVNIVVTPEIEEKVSPAGVDQSKAVPILLAKIEQLERRLSAAGL